VANEQKSGRAIGGTEVHLYGGLLSLAAGGAAWHASARPLGAFLCILGSGFLTLGWYFLRRS
jgi:hypothetical protein